jgi:TPR repeat protein
MMMRASRLLPALSAILALSLTGCAAYTQAAFTAKDMGEREIYQEKADAGDADAEYRLGDSWCCTVLGHHSHLQQKIHDNQTATEWLCKSAHQNYAPAQITLARIYSGRPFRYNSMKQLAEKVKGAPKNMAAALMWARQAQANNSDDAADLIKTITDESSSEEQALADRMSQSWASQPCTWDETVVTPAE